VASLVERKQAGGDKLLGESMGCTWGGKPDLKPPVGAML
jgi:hypothetical protein